MRRSRLFSQRPQVRLEALERRDVPTAIMPPPGLVSWWPGDGDALDIVGSNNGTLQNGADHYQGKVSDGFNFDGQDDLLEASSTGLPVGNADRTVSLWVKIDQPVAEEAFFVSYGNPGSSNQVYTIGVHYNAGLFVSTWGPTIFGPVLQNDLWYHVVASNAGTTFRLYLDGSNLRTGNLSVNTPVGSTFWMGRQSPGAAGNIRRLDGMVDEVAVFDRALTDVEIFDIYQAGRDGMLKPYMVVNDSTPGEGDIVDVPPTQYVIDFTHPVNVTTLQAGDLTVNGIAANSYSIIDDNTVAFDFATSPVSSQGTQTMNMAAGALQASGNVAEPALRAWTKTFDYIGTLAPAVQAIQVNDGSVQRSRVTNLTATFNTEVTFAGFPADAFTLTRTGGGSVSFTATSSIANGVTVVTLNNFTGAETQSGSLRDGRYTLTALASQISANGQQMASNYTFGDAQGLFRYYGDMNGDRRVDISDFGFFSLAFLQTPNYNAALDFNNDGRIDIADFGQFSARFFTTLP